MVVGHVQEMALVETYIDTSGVVRVRNSLRITPSAGAIFYTNFDPGTANVRGSSSPMPDADGTLDQTRFMDAKAVALSVVIVSNAFKGLEERLELPPGSRYGVEDLNSSEWWLEQLEYFMHASKGNLRLYYRMTGSQRARFMNVRPAGMSKPITMTARQTRDVQLQFVCPSGKSYAFNPDSPDGLFTKTFGIFDADTPGITFPIDFTAGPLVFPAQLPGVDGTKTLYSDGSAPTPFLARIFAGSNDLVLPVLKVRHLDPLTGLEDYPVQTISFNYTLPAGQYLSIDTLTRETFIGDNRANRLGAYLLATTWAQLRPGQNRIELTATSAGADATTQITWSDAYL